MDGSRNEVETKSGRDESSDKGAARGVRARSTPVVSSIERSHHHGSNGADSKSRMCENATSVTEKKLNQSPDSSIDPSHQHQETSASRTRMAAHMDEDTASRPGSSNSSESMERTEIDGDSSGKTEKKRKRALRKGKWAVEEEEYTSRVIQHFSAGLLTLPDGATLRSYLADKLNCDPMRITKKFTGACCLGRRVYHLRDRPRPTPAELEMAKTERDHLEQRFRLRIENEQSGLPLSRTRDILLAQPQSNVCALYPMHNFSVGNTLSPWLQNLGPSGLAGATGPGSLPGRQNFLSSGSNQHSLANLQQNSRWLVPGVAESIINNATQNDPSIQLLSQLVTSWAVAQAAASLPPGALASLAAAAADPAANSLQGSSSMLLNQSKSSSTPAVVPPSQPMLDLQQQLRNVYEEQIREEEQRQLRAAFEEEKRKKDEREKAAAEAEAAATSAVLAAAQDRGRRNQDSKKPREIGSPAPTNEISPAEQLQKSYEAHLEALRKKEVGNRLSVPGKDSQKGPVRGDGHQLRVSMSNDTLQEFSKKTHDWNDQPMPDEEAGTVLLGFLNSLRQSYEDAVDKKTGESNTSHEEKTNHNRREQQTFRTFPNIASAVFEDDNKRRNSGTKRLHSKSAYGGQNRQRRDDKNPTTHASFMNASVGRRSQRPASVTDTSSGNSSSQQAEFSSSLEDSSDKSDPSSSEDSDKEATERQKRRQSKGPPRKRLKSFIKESPIAHCKRAAQDVQD